MNGMEHWSNWPQRAFNVMITLIVLALLGGTVNHEVLRKPSQHAPVTAEQVRQWIKTAQPEELAAAGSEIANTLHRYAEEATAVEAQLNHEQAVWTPVSTEQPTVRNSVGEDHDAVNTRDETENRRMSTRDDRVAISATEESVTPMRADELVTSMLDQPHEPAPAMAPPQTVTAFPQPVEELIAGDKRFEGVPRDAQHIAKVPQSDGNYLILVLVYGKDGDGPLHYWRKDRQAHINYAAINIQSRTPEGRFVTSFARYNPRVAHDLIKTHHDDRIWEGPWWISVDSVTGSEATNIPVFTGQQANI
jgi:hypothetical protein